MHYYYRQGDALPSSINDGDVRIDFKGGCKHFVIGPGSIRPDGTVYRATCSLIRLHDLPRFADYGQRAAKQDVDCQSTTKREHSASIVPAGNRNRTLCNFAIATAPHVSSRDELRNWLIQFADSNCAQRHTLPDAEVVEIADWAWGKRCANQLYGDHRSAFRISRPSLDRICSAGKRGPNALMLYSRLLEAHSHMPGKIIAIAVAAMCRDGLLPYSASTADRARDTLRDIGLIELVKKGGFKEPDQYRLANALVLRDR